ncbi:thaumatin-like protein 1b [Amborella trichopoda]|uniref:Thaumatin-like protein n=1 Tax=Amborella trichopoda TaxID=13333 RepID=W1PZA1_AMBTC|nr:thaumatin-like protein 1b [Amborella trichopoda]ERN13381.1 hypothetical protein AMTR_s00041p00164900 [Amborella trichopoda]|eukprot:XP_006851914.1 thaumatin-like protein 1b [Amborella trichopoda]
MARNPLQRRVLSSLLNGFSLQPSSSLSLNAPSTWSGRMWARTLCTTDSTTANNFTCQTGDCGSNKIECLGGGAAPPATLAEFTIQSGGLDFYDVSLVDGYNLPMLISIQGGSGNCSTTGCLVDLNEVCPSDLRVQGLDGKESVACKSACEAFGSPQYCCSGAYGNPNTCKPTSYSQFFKNACPRAYSYAYDDATSTFTCSGADYVITFCPSIPNQKSQGGGDHPEAVLPPLINDTMIFTGNPQDYSKATPKQTTHMATLIALTLGLSLWWLS